MGVTEAKNSPALLLAVTLTSPDGSLPQQYLSNYATVQILDRLSRIRGVGGARLFRGRDYNMRIWINPGRAAGLNLTVDEVIAAGQAQNPPVTAGPVRQPPFNPAGPPFQFHITAK